MFIVAASPSYAGEVATFESFYTESSFWTGFSIVLIGGTVILLSGGGGTPFVAPWLVVLLGGGAVVITLNFGKEIAKAIVLDYTINQVIIAYNQAQFVKQSKKMATLPLPRNTYGPDIYEDAIEILEEIDKDSFYSNYSSPSNQKNY
ncbi:membrane protein [Beggiatoa sp. PS]|nr:membrane protein [Beggiatoa sp. PS]